VVPTVDRRGLLPHEDREYMDLYSAPGTKVVLWYLKNGYEGQQQELARLGMMKGDVFTIDRTEVHSSSTSVYLREFPGKTFNSVHFAKA
jgi:hypothetical protein